MTPEVVTTLFGHCIAAGLLVGALIVFTNSWRP